MKRKTNALALLAACALMLTGCHVQPDGDGSLQIEDWISGEADEQEIARSVGAFGTSLTQEAAGNAQSIISALFEGAGITSLADILPTAEDLAGFLPAGAVDADQTQQGENHEHVGF